MISLRQMRAWSVLLKILDYLDYAVAKDYQCIGANQWSISGPSVVQALQRFWASTARDSSKEAQLHTAARAFLVHPRAAVGHKYL